MGASVKITKNIYAQRGGHEGLVAAILETLLRVHAGAVALCPVQYGQLRNSLMIKTGEESKFNSQGKEMAPATDKLTVKGSDTIGYVGTNSDHWYPEFGTRFQVAQPFLRPAGELAKGSSAKSVVMKYCRDKMVEEFNRRKVQITTKDIK